MTGYGWTMDDWRLRRLVYTPVKALIPNCVTFCVFLGIAEFVKYKSFSVILRNAKLCVSSKDEQQIPGEVSRHMILSFKELRSLAIYYILTEFFLFVQ